MNRDLDTDNTIYDEVSRMVHGLAENMRLMGIAVEDDAEYCEASVDENDDIIRDSPELDRFLSEFVVTQKGR